MGDKVNSKARTEYASTLSPDGKYLFFMSDRIQNEKEVTTPMTMELIDEIYQSGGQGLTSVYWMKSDFINDLRQKAQWYMNAIVRSRNGIFYINSVPSHTFSVPVVSICIGVCSII